MAKPNYQYQKKLREQAKKKKNDEKLLKRGALRSAEQETPTAPDAGTLSQR